MAMEDAPGGSTSSGSNILVPQMLPCEMSMAALEVGKGLAIWSAAVSVCATEDTERSLTLLARLAPEWLESLMFDLIGTAGPRHRTRNFPPTPTSQLARNAAGGSQNRSHGSTRRISSRSDDLRSCMAELICSMLTQKPSREIKNVANMRSHGERFKDSLVKKNDQEFFHHSLCPFVPSVAFYQNTGMHKKSAPTAYANLHGVTEGKGLQSIWFTAGATACQACCESSLEI